MSDQQTYKTVPASLKVPDRISFHKESLEALGALLATVMDERDALRAEVETERMRLAACSVAAGQNTEASKAERLDPDSPYYSASYADVCAAVDREIALLAEADRLKAQSESEPRRASYWKAEHEAANEVIDTLRARVAALEAALGMAMVPLDEINNYLNDYPYPISTISDVFHWLMFHHRVKQALALRGEGE